MTQMMMQHVKAPDPTDRHVGARVKMRRLMLGMSQGKLGGALGLTFQQVQKYEKGMNRIGASRLRDIAAILQVPVSFFFEDGPLAGSSKDSNAPSTDIVTSFLTSRDGLGLARAFLAIKNAKLKRAIVQLVETLGGDVARIDSNAIKL